MGYWNAVGLTAAMSVLLLLAIASHAPSAIGRAVALAGTPIGIATVYLTYARSPLGAAALGAVVLLATSRNRATFLLQAAATGLAGALVISTIRGQEQIALGTGGAGRGAVLTSLLIAAAALAVVGALTGRIGVDRIRMPRRPAMIAATATVIVGLVVGIAALDRYGQDAWDSFTTPEQGGSYVDPSQRLTTLNTTRAQQWEKALEAWRDEPGTGYGAGTFELIYNQRQETGEFVRDAHNAYVETLAEQGTPGLVLLVGFLASAAAALALALRRATTDFDRGLLAGATAVFAAFVLGTGVDWFWEVTAIAMMVLALVGAALAATARPDDDTRPRRLPAGPCAPDSSRSRSSRSWPSSPGSSAPPRSAAAHAPSPPAISKRPATTPTERSTSCRGPPPRSCSAPSSMSRPASSRPRFARCSSRSVATRRTGGSRSSPPGSRRRPAMPTRPLPPTAARRNFDRTGASFDDLSGRRAPARR